MNRVRSWTLGVAGLAVAIGLFTAMVLFYQVTLDDVVKMWTRANPAAVGMLFLLIGCHMFVAAWKWHLVEQQLGNLHSSLRHAFLLSAIGTAGGQLLPIQAAAALTRGIGNRIAMGSGGVRGAMGSVWEQSFDLLVTIALLPAALIALAAGSTDHVALIGIVSLAAVAIPLRFAPSLAALFGRRIHHARIVALLDSGLFTSGHMAQLYLLSILRFVILFAMACATTHAINAEIPAVDFLAALPIAVLASTLSMLPAGLGANEWSFTSALTLLGTPAVAAAGWAVLNRLLVAQGSILIGAAAFALSRNRRATSTI